MTNIEYVLIASLIVVVLTASLLTVGQSSSHTYDRLASSIAATSETSASTGISPIDNQTAIEIQAAENSRLQFLLLFTTVALTVTGVRHIAYSKRKTKPSPVDCPETAIVLKQQSEALRHILDKRNVIHSQLCHNWIQMIQGDADISPYMSTELVSVRPDMRCQDCLEMLIENGYRRVMVTDQQGHLLGVVSKKDIQSKVGKIVSDVMTSDPKIAQPTTSLRVALSLLIAHRVSCIPIVENGLLVGLLSTSDLLVVLQSIVIILSGESKIKLRKEELKFNEPKPAPFTPNVDISTSTNIHTVN
jgi:CBS domain-containing protein/Flp pilus assembly pilin Flp